MIFKDRITEKGLVSVERYGENVLVPIYIKNG